MNFKNIIETNSNNIKHIIQVMTNEQNEDLEQEVYIKAWKKSDSYREQGKFQSWIGVIAKNFSKDYLKSAQKKQADKSISDDTVLNTISEQRENPEQALLKKERQKRITDAVNSLKPKLKQVIIMYEFYNMSYDEIAKELKCPQGTVKSRLFNAKQQLAQILEDLM